MEHNVNDLLTKKEACAYLKISQAVFEYEVKQGHIAFRTCGKRIKFPVWELENWRKSTMKHTDYIKEGKRGMRTYHSTQRMDGISSLENLYVQTFGRKPSAV